MKLLLDMGISIRLVPELRSSGHEATHLDELSLQTVDDSEALAKAAREGWILVTHDLDFPELIAASGARLPSVILFRLRNMRPENVLRYLRSVLRNFGEVLEGGAIVTVTEAAFRVRRLPISNE